MIPSQRHLFDIPDDVAYLNCAYMGPMSKAAVAAGALGAAGKGRPWEITAADFFTDSERARGLFAALVNGSPEDVAIVPSASYGIAVAARNIPVRPGQTILVLEDQFPSNMYAWRETAIDSGAEIVTVARPADHDWTRAVIAEINERTAVAALPNCHWTDGELLDLARIGAHCRATKTALVLDLTQSAGAMPFDVATVRPDFVVAACYKWLLGPYSLGFLLAAPQWHEGAPLEYNWIARTGSENFGGLVRYVDAYQAGARRYDMGERSNFQLMPIAIAALEQILGWGVGEIAATLAARTAVISKRASALGLIAGPPELRAGHFLGLRFPDRMPADLLARLAQKRVHVSVRGDSMRVTPHLYNTDEDVDRLFEALEEILTAAASAA